MAKKKIFLYTIALIITLIIGIGIGVLFSHIGSKDGAMYVDNISKQEAFNNKLAEQLVSTIKCYEDVDDAIVNTETSPIQVNIITKTTNSITSEAKENIEELVSHVFPDSTVDYLFSDKTDN